jgi:DNA polymerase zeta
MTNFSHKHLDASYYISRVLIPPLERIFNLVGADVRGWYDEMPKTARADYTDPAMLSPQKDTKDAGNLNRLKIDEHFRSSQCVVCRGLASDGIFIAAVHVLKLYCFVF